MDLMKQSFYHLTLCRYKDEYYKEMIRFLVFEGTFGFLDDFLKHYEHHRHFL
jgi:hypothetical protein